MLRSELVDAVVEMLNDAPGVLVEDDMRTWIMEVLDTAEPLIRQDERERNTPLDIAALIARVRESERELGEALQRNQWVELRAKVQSFYDKAKWAQQADAYYEVLELLDEADR